jgi:dolichyl-phosphate-mannose-protein mannosyltransferase
MMKSHRLLPACFAILLICACFSSRAEADQNLLINGDFSQGTDTHATGWRTESWLDRDTTTFTWIPPFGAEPGEVEISNDQLNDSRWVQSTILSPGLYYASADIFTHAVPVSSWAGALISIGDQSVASLDVKGNSNWQTRGVYFRVSRPHTQADVKLRIAGFENFAIGQAYFRNASLVKLDRAPPDAMVLDLDANTRLWQGHPWTLIPIWLLLGAAFVLSWRMLDPHAEQGSS